MKKLTAIITCIIIGMVVSHAQTQTTDPPKAPTITACFGAQFYRKQQIKIKCATNGARIFYTTDGTSPTEKSTEYIQDSLYIDKTTTIKAIAILNGKKSKENSKTCTQKIRTVAIVAKIDDKYYALGKEKYNSNYLKAEEYDGTKILRPELFELYGWGIQDKNIVNIKNITNFLYNPNSTYIKFSSNSKDKQNWTISDDEIKTTEDNRILRYNSGGYFAAYTLTYDKTSPKAYPVDIVKGTSFLGLTVGNFGTLCLPYDVLISDTQGGTFYNIIRENSKRR